MLVFGELFGQKCVDSIYRKAVLMVVENLNLKLDVQHFDNSFRIFLTTVTPNRAAVFQMRLDVVITTKSSDLSP